MESFSDKSQILLNTLLEFGERFMSAVPLLLAAIAVLLLGWVFAKIAQRIVTEILNRVKINDLAEKMGVNKVLERSNITSMPSQIVGSLVYWLVILLFVISATDILHWRFVSDQLMTILNYLPLLFSAVVIAILGLFLANFIRKGIKTLIESLAIDGGAFIANFVFYLLAAIVILAALKQAEVDTSIIENNLVVIVAAIAISFGLSFILATLDVFPKLIGTLYAKRVVEEGDEVQFKNIEGKVISVTNTSVCIETEEKIIYVPASELLQEVIFKSGSGRQTTETQAETASV